MQNRLRPWLMIAAFAGGALFPQLHLNGLLKYLLILILFHSFCGMRLSEMRLRRHHWILLGTRFALAGLATAVVGFWRGREFAQAAFWVAICPTATAAPVYITFLGGSMEFVLTHFLLDTVAVSLALPLLVPLFGTRFDWSVAWHTALNLAQLTLLPAVAAFLARRVWPRIHELAPRCKGAAFGLWIGLLFIIATSASRFLHENASTVSAGDILTMAAIAVTLCAISFSLGRLIGAPSLRSECSQALGQKNTSLAIVLALTCGSPFIALAPTFYTFSHNLWNAIQLRLHERKARRPKSPPPT